MTGNVGRMLQTVVCLGVGCLGVLRLSPLWAQEPKLRYTLKGHTGIVICVAFSPDGKMLASGNQDHTIKLWDVATGKPLGMPLKHPGWWVRAVAFSPDGQRVATAGEHKVSRIWAVPVPVAGEVERLQLWVQVLTGLELDADGAVGALDAERWQERRKHLEELGGPPLR